MKSDTEKYLEKRLEPFWQKLENLDKQWGWNDFIGCPYIVPSLCGRVIHVVYSGGYAIVGVGSLPWHIVKELGLVTLASTNTVKWVVFGNDPDSRKKYSTLAKRRWLKSLPGLVDIVGAPVTRIGGGVMNAFLSIIHPGLEAKSRKHIFQNLERKRYELEILIEEAYPKNSEIRRRGGSNA